MLRCLARERYDASYTVMPYLGESLTAPAITAEFRGKVGSEDLPAIVLLIPAPLV